MYKDSEWTILFALGGSLARLGAFIKEKVLVVDSFSEYCVSRNIVDTFNQQSCSAWHPTLEINSSKMSPGVGLQVAAECGHLMIQTQVLASHKTIAGISRIITRGNNIKMRRLETRIHNMYTV